MRLRAAGLFTGTLPRRLFVPDTHDDVAGLTFEEFAEAFEGRGFDVLHLVIVPPAARGRRRYVHGHLELVRGRETFFFRQFADPEAYHAREYSTVISP